MSKETKTTRELSYYELYLLDYLRQHKFTQQHDRDFIRTRADEAAETYEQERRSLRSPSIRCSMSNWQRTFCRSWARCFPSMTLPMMIFHSLTNTRTSTMN